MLTKLTQQKDDDEIDLFMKSIAMMVKMLPPHLSDANQAKLQILTLVTNLQGSHTSPYISQAQSTAATVLTNETTSVDDIPTPCQFSYYEL